MALRTPPELKGFLDFIPPMAYVQARSELAVGIKFRTSAELLQRCAKHLEGEDTIAVPVAVAVPDQVTPVSFPLG